MRMSRRDLVRPAAVAGASTTFDLRFIERAFAQYGDPRMIWLQWQGCSGCPVSLPYGLANASPDDGAIDAMPRCCQTHHLAAVSDPDPRPGGTHTHSWRIVLGVYRKRQGYSSRSGADAKSLRSRAPQNISVTDTCSRPDACAKIAERFGCAVDSWLETLAPGDPSCTPAPTTSNYAGFGLTEAPRGALGH